MNIDSYFADVKYFTPKELLRSNTAIQNGFDEQFDPPESVIVALHMLCENVLDKARETLGYKITVTSGYRCKRVNDAVGSSDTSHHLRGMAADLKCADLNSLFYVLRGLQFTQLIRYYEDENPDNPLVFLHVSYDPDNLKCEIKERYSEGGKLHYRKWEAK